MGPIVFIDSNTVHAKAYISILQDNLLPFLHALNTDEISDTVFQQDNAPPHISKVSRKWLENVGKEHGFTIIYWPVDFAVLEENFCQVTL